MADKVLTQSDDEILEVFERQWAPAKKAAEKQHDKFRYLEKVYKGTTNPLFGKPRNPDDPHDWRSRIFPPFANEQIETLIAELIQDDPKAEIVAREPEKADQAHIVSDAVDYYMERDHFNEKWPRAVRREEKFGTAIFKVINKHETCVDQIKGPDGKLIDHEYSKYLGPATILINMFDGFPDPAANDIDDSRFFFHRITGMHMADLESRLREDGTPLYHNLDLLPKTGAAGEDIQRFPNESVERQNARRQGSYNLIERWTPLYVTTVSCGVVIRHERNPIGFIPFVVLRGMEDEESFWGFSRLELIADIQDALWTLLNRYIDAINLRINPPHSRDEDDNAKASQVEIYPGAQIDTRDPTRSYVALDIAKVDTFGIDTMIKMLRELMERFTGANSSLAGASDANSATQASIDVRQGKGRISVTIRQLDHGYVRLRRIFLKMIQKFVDEPIIARVTDGRTIAFMPDELYGEYDFIVGSLSSDRALVENNKQDAVALLNAINPLINPATAPQIAPETYEGVIKKLLTAFKVDERQPLGEPPPPEQPAPEAAGPEQLVPHVNEIVQYDKAPPSIQRQIESQMGFTPATDEEHKAQVASLKPTPPAPKPAAKG